MATARQAAKLRCWADLTNILGAFQARLPELLPADSGLKVVADASCSGRVWQVHVLRHLAAAAQSRGFNRDGPQLSECSDPRGLFRDHARIVELGCARRLRLLTITFGPDHTGRRGQPPQLSL